VYLITLIPRNYSLSTNNIYSKINDNLLLESKKDRFILNFTQFYNILIIITEIVYSDLFHIDMTVAFNKFIQVFYFLIIIIFFFI
jgi:hypothetical protein